VSKHQEIRDIQIVLHLEPLSRLSLFPAPSGGPGWEPEKLSAQASRTVQHALEEIKRHLHDIALIGNPEWHIFAPEVCDNCEREWEEDDDGSPVCCMKAYDEWAQKTGAPSRASEAKEK
jgi:hypothetical protein